MTFALIICTYMRPVALLNLLNSVTLQTRYPNEILIIDGSTDNETEFILKKHPFKNLIYYKVDKEYRGLTKQRNYGISKVDPDSEVICFLDDDIILEPDYFKCLLNTYVLYPNALGVGGYITNEVHWEPSDGKISSNTFHYDGWMRKEPLRFQVRNWFGLAPDTPPCFLPTFSHGRSIGFLPPSGKIYPVEQFMGGVSSYRKSVFESLSFSAYFEGYGLYEDLDFCLRLSKKGELYVNTSAKLEHHHEPLGRPNQYKYGKMVVRNGWYVWRVKYPNPKFNDRLRWNAVTILLAGIRFSNVLNLANKNETLIEVFGRIVGLGGILFNKPKVLR